MAISDTGTECPYCHKSVMEWSYVGGEWECPRCGYTTTNSEDEPIDLRGLLAASRRIRRLTR